LIWARVWSTFLWRSSRPPGARCIFGRVCEGLLLIIWLFVVMGLGWLYMLPIFVVIIDNQYILWNIIIYLLSINVGASFTSFFLEFWKSH
jgi:hypothetical protein